MLIEEQDIDNILAIYDQEDDEDIFLADIEAFNEAQPDAYSYLFSEDAELLTQDEKEWLVYIAVVIWKAIVAKKPNLKAIAAEDLEAAEERNWELLEEVTEKRFSDRMTVFFDDSDEEELLAFIEDSLVDDDELGADALISKEGREPMFVALKSLVDVFIAA